MTERISRRKIPMSGRRKESEQSYQRAKRAGEVKNLDTELVLVHYNYWFLIANRFPYDLLFDVHDLLVTKRKISNRYELNVQELVELTDIIRELENQYHIVFENTPVRRSVPDHFHVHLARFYPDRENLKL